MDKFQDAYQEAAKELPKFHMDAEKVQDELHHYKMVKQGRRYLIMKGCTAAAIFLLCGAGTVAAKNFRNSFVRVSDNGFVISSGNTMDQELSGEQGLSGDRELSGGQEPSMEVADSRKGVPDTASILKIGGVSSTEGDVPDEAGGMEEGLSGGGESSMEEEISIEEYEPETEEYDSLEDFYAGSDVVVAIPGSELLGMEFTDERVDIIDGGRNVFVILRNEDEDFCFSLTQSDNRGYESYSSATSFMGESRNERRFANSQGLNYVVIDSVDENGEVMSVHAAISVNGRDLTLSFQGFEENVVEKVLYELDLSGYFQE